MTGEVIELGAEMREEIRFSEASLKGAYLYVDRAAAYLYESKYPGTDVDSIADPAEKARYQGHVMHLRSNVSLIAELLDATLPLKGESWRHAIDIRFLELEDFYTPADQSATSMRRNYPSVLSLATAS